VFVSNSVARRLSIAPSSTLEVETSVCLSSVEYARLHAGGSQITCEHGGASGAMHAPSAPAAQRWAVLLTGAALWYLVAVLMVGDQVRVMCDGTFDIACERPSACPSVSPVCILRGGARI
jgi:hypothetical protein